MSSRLLVEELPQPQLSGEFFCGLDSRKPDDFIAQDAFFYIGRMVLSEDFDLSVVFDPGHEKSILIADLLKPPQIIVTLVEGVDAVRHD